MKLEAIPIRCNRHAFGAAMKTVEAMDLCHLADNRTIILHRSGDATDDFITDFAAVMRAGQIKAIALCPRGRIAKYNRQFAIERNLSDRAQILNPFVRP